MTDPNAFTAHSALFKPHAITRHAIDRLASELLDERPSAPVDQVVGTNPFSDQVVMVTGAGGSVGTELCEQLIDLGVGRLVLFDVSEFNLYQLLTALSPKAQEAGVELCDYLASVTNQKAVENCIQAEGVSIILHAAAYKHVPMIERNPIAGVWNNVLGTKILGDAARRLQVDRFVLVSTDKAVLPNSIMGASKRLAELIVEDMAHTATTTKFCTVRFGNVLGSSGSVLPRFLEQISTGGPLTITDARMQRFFTTIPEAARLILTATALSDGGELFVLDAGQQVRIVELAKRLIKACNAPETPIRVTGQRQGERLDECLTMPSADLRATIHPKINITVEQKSDLDLPQTLGQIVDAINAHDAELVRTIVLGAETHQSQDAQSARL